jgi:hypothetical protein
MRTCTVAGVRVNPIASCGQWEAVLEDVISITETMYLDPQTGVLERMVGGVPGQEPSVVVTYTIRRVTAADAMR